jgi:chromosome segregation ATPase
MFRSRHSSALRFTRLLALCGGLCGAANMVVAEESAEQIELQSNLRASASRVRELESRLQVASQQAQTTAAGMASASKHAAESQERYEALRSAVSGIGIAGMDENGESLQQRLLAALAELKAARERVTALEAALAQAAEELNAPEGKAAAAVTINKALTQNGTALSPNAMAVADVKSESGLVIIQLPQNGVVRAGGKVAINTQKGSKVEGLVVEVRDTIACAVVNQSLAVMNPPSVGDSVELVINQ